MPSSTLNLSDLDGSNGFAINSPSSAAYSSSSLSISSAGDINGDGFTDLFVSLANTSIPDGDYDFPSSYYAITARSSYIVFGGPNVGAGGSIDLSTLDGNNGFRLDSTYYSSPYDFQSGLSVTTGSDLNNDGIADLIINASNSTSVVFGGTNIGAGGSIDRSTLDGSNGFTINGTQSDYFSYSVSTTRDINGDGIADLIVLNPDADPNGITNAGSIYVVFGGTNIGAGGSINQSTLDGINGFVINGTNQNDRLGRSVISNSDLNNDGIADLIIGVPDANPNGIGNAGSIYVVFGGTDMGAGGSIDPSTLEGNNGFVINGTNQNDYLGRSVISNSDLNNDGVADLIIGNSNADPNGINNVRSTYVVFGGTNIGAGGSINLFTLDGSNGFVIKGTNLSGSLGSSVISNSDLNGDGIADLIISAPYADPKGILNAGSIYVVFGGTNVGAGGSIDPLTLDGSNGFVINGTNQNDRLGSSVISNSDLNGDGIADVIISKPYAGSTYVVFGGTNIGASGIIDPSTLDGSNGFVINGTNPSDYLGSSVISNSDINNDGITDMIIGVPAADPNDINNAGSTYVVFGGTNMGGDGTLNLSALDGRNGFVINGVVVGEHSADSIQGLGDINGDGIDDVIIGNARYNDYYAEPRNISGASYVVFGSPASVAAPTAGNDTLIGTDAGEFIRGCAGDDLLNGRNGDDILLGDFGNDTLIGGNGDDLLMGSFGNDSLGVRHSHFDGYKR
jgi:hypothetical protein